MNKRYIWVLAALSVAAAWGIGYYRLNAAPELPTAATVEVTRGDVMEWSTPVTSNAVLLAFGFAAAVGVFFGFYPARKAAGLNPIEALRYE